MAFEKRMFSYIVWGLHSILACIGFAVILLKTLDATPLTNPYGQIGIVCLSFVLTAGVFLLVRKIANSCGGEGNGVRKAVAEAVAAVLLLAAGVTLRVLFLDKGMEEAAYFDMAQVNGEGIPSLSYGAQYLYVCMLRALFYAVGNHFTAGVILQIVLQTGGALVFYLAVRRFSGASAGIVALAVLMFMPSAIREALVYSPRMLYFLLFSIVLLMVGRMTARQKKDKFAWYGWLHTVLCGAAIAVVTYLDGAGVLLFIPVFGIVLAKERKRLLCQWGVVLAGFLAVLVLLFFADASLSGADFVSVCRVWAASYVPQSPVLSDLVFLRENTVMELVLLSVAAFVILLGLPGFFCSRREECQTPFMMLEIGLVLLCVCRTDHVQARYEYLMLAVFAAMTGAAVRAVSAHEKTGEDAEENSVSQLPAAVAALSEAVDPPEDGKVKLIDNPLPLPKRHVKKTMGYQREVPPEEMHYDIEVEENDDFDLKK